MGEFEEIKDLKEVVGGGVEDIYRVFQPITTYKCN
jgi:hypothetical protein